MAKRGGKAASRKSRQRRAQRGPAPRPQAAASTPSFEESAAVAAQGAASASAFDRADAEVRAMTSAQAGAARPRQRRGPSVPFGATGPSRLSEQAIAEYHYVLRDLRNIGVLLAILVVLLLVATLVVNATGIGPG